LTPALHDSIIPCHSKIASIWELLEVPHVREFGLDITALLEEISPAGMMCV